MANMTFKARLLPAVNDSTEYTLGSSTVGWQYYGKISINSKSAPSSNTSYLVPILDSNSTTMSSLNSHSSLRHWLFKDGGGALAIGTNTAAGDLILYSGLASNKYIQLSPPTSMSSTWRNIYFPDASGTIALTNDLSNYSTTSHTHSTYVLKAGDTMTGSLTVNRSTYSDGASYIRLVSNRSVGIHVGSGGTNRGLYDWSKGGWIIYCNGNSANTEMQLYGAVWNDYAEMRNVPEAQKLIKITKNKDNEDIRDYPLSGRCVREVGDGTMVLSTSRLERGCKIISDTFGFNIGETDDCKTPIAVSGRALAYLSEGREVVKQHIGWPVCSGPNGTVSIMTEEEEEKYPSRIVGTISEIPEYETWGSGNVPVNGRIWIYVR